MTISRLQSKRAIGPKRMVALAVLPLLAGCGAGDALGINKRPPDEFAVVAEAPLVVPPDFHLRPPDAANPRPESADSESLAIQALFPGRTDLPPQPSSGEQALLRSAGALASDASVRSSLNNDEEVVVSKGNLTAEILRSDAKQDEKTRTERLAPETVRN